MTLDENFEKFSRMKRKRVLITGAGGYVGSLLVPHLLQQGHFVRAFDTFWFGNTLPQADSHLEIIKGDLRTVDFSKILTEIDTVIHLASISNDPSCDLDPTFTDEINVKASIRLIDHCRIAKINRFIFASSSSVYGVKKEDRVTEGLSLSPLTIYSKSKIEIENYLKNFVDAFDSVVLRPATVYGVAPRLRLDVVTNILSAQAFFNEKITIHGGDQFRPQIHIKDMVRAYELCVTDSREFKGAIYNVGERNYSVSEIAKTIQSCSPQKTELIFEPVKDPRSYRISSDAILEQRGFAPKYDLKSGVVELMKYFSENPGINWLNENFHNVKKLKNILESNQKWVVLE